MSTAYVIRRNEDGKFVSQLGSKSSYTQFLQKARTWPTREAAAADCCGNERVMSVADAMGGEQ